jgi:hypothetical protein
VDSEGERYSKEELIMVFNLPCKNCNFKTGQSTCWYFGEMNFADIVDKALQGCEKHRLWWMMSGSKCE